MGVSSTHLAFENMILAGIPTGGRRNAVEDRMVDDRRLAATARHRCILNHRLVGLSEQCVTVLRAAYSGEDWTRTLDERVGRGPRQALHRRFSHELLQVAPLTTLAQAGCVGTTSGQVSAEAVYRDGRGEVEGIAKALSVEIVEQKAAMLTAIRAATAQLVVWIKKRERPRWTSAPEEVFAQLRIVLGQRKPDHRATVALVRQRISAYARPATRRAVAYVVGRGAVVTKASTPREYLLLLLRSKNERHLDRIREEARQMLAAACKEAKVATVAQAARRGARRPAWRQRSERRIQSVAETLSRG